MGKFQPQPHKKLDEPWPKLTLRTLDSDGAINLIERVVTDCADEYIELVARSYLGIDTARQMARLERFFFEHPFCTALHTDPEDMIAALRKRGRIKYLQEMKDKPKDEIKLKHIGQRKDGREMAKVDAEAAARLRTQGVTITDIAKVYGVGRNTVSRVLKKMGEKKINVADD